MTAPFQVGTYFEPDDVLDHDDADGWTSEQAEEFLRKHEAEIRDALAMAGFHIIENLLEPRQTALTFD